MKNTLTCFLILSVFLSISSCEVVPQEEDILESKNEPYYSFDQLIQQAIPSQNKPSRVTRYQMDRFINHKDKYYDSQENELLDIYLTESLDTAGITIYSYSEGLVQELNHYLKRGLGFYLSSTLKYHYNSENILQQTTRDGENYMLYKYNSLGQIVEILLGPNLNVADVYYYFYDENGRTIRQIWGSQNIEDSPIRDWHYIYDESGKLISKSIPVFPDGNLRPMFLFSFDDQGRMTLEEELYPEYNFSSYFKTFYSYSSIN